MAPRTDRHRIRPFSRRRTRRRFPYWPAVCDCHGGPETEVSNGEAGYRTAVASTLLVLVLAHRWKLWVFGEQNHRGGRRVNPLGRSEAQELAALRLDAPPAAVNGKLRPEARFRPGIDRRLNHNPGERHSPFKDG